MQRSAITATPRARSRWLPVTVRWMLSFVGFPLGGFASLLVVGSVDSVPTSLVGGLITGLFIGAAQAVGMGRAGLSAPHWIAATAVGMVIGLGVGAAAVGYATTLTALAVQGAINGLAVGVAQALVLRPRLGRLALTWPAALALFWAIGWVVTTLGGIEVGRQFTVFGSFGALTVTALTLVLPLTLHRTEESSS